MPRQSAHVALLTESSDCATVQLLDIFIYNIFLWHLLIKKKQKAEGTKKEKKRKSRTKKREKKKKRARKKTI